MIAAPHPLVFIIGGALWLLVVVVVIAMCVAAARGDEGDRARSVDWCDQYDPCATPRRSREQRDETRAQAALRPRAGISVATISGGFLPPAETRTAAPEGAAAQQSRTGKNEELRWGQ